MIVEIKRIQKPEDHLINEIIDMEWEMFDKVSNQGGRAACQDDAWTFYAMRYSQFSFFNMDMLKSYIQDLYRGIEERRNLVMEKYAYMMEFTDGAYFDKYLKKQLPVVSAIKEDLVDRIANILIRCEQQFDNRYPALAGRSRPVTGVDKDNVSFHIYTIGELKTYSENTLSLYYKYLHEIDTESEAENPSFKIHRATVEFYGYKSLDDAEARLV